MYSYLMRSYPNTIKLKMSVLCKATTSLPSKVLKLSFSVEMKSSSLVGGLRFLPGRVDVTVSDDAALAVGTGSSDKTFKTLDEVTSRKYCHLLAMV